MNILNPPLQAELGLQIGDQIFSCPKKTIAEVIRIDTWSPAPATPGYVLGVIEQNGQIYTVLDITQLDASAESEEPALPKPSEPSIGLVIEHPDYFPIVLLGQGAVSFNQAETHDWETIDLPPAFKKDPKAPELIYQKVSL